MILKAEQKKNFCKKKMTIKYFNEGTSYIKLYDVDAGVCMTL
jgi:hypothetical protein